MVITIVFSCRNCGEPNVATTDTANYGVLDPNGDTVAEALVLDLACAHCDQVSGSLGLGYDYWEGPRRS